MRTVRNAVRLLPGVALCVAIAAAAMGLQAAEDGLWGRAYLEALVIAILLGIAVRAAWSPGEAWQPGIHFSAKTLLEVAIALLGVSINAQVLVAVGAELLVGIVLVVLVALALSYAISRWAGLPQRLSLLIACGNCICGNSAIVAVAPVIGASARDIGASISFTAVLGVAVVLALPLLAAPLGLAASQFGVLAGLTVYAVPQVLAATIPVSFQSAQIATLVKLVRVMMLGPLVLLFSVLGNRFLAPSADAQADHAPKRSPWALSVVAPWYILAFAFLAGLRSFGLVPAGVVQACVWAATTLTVLAMAALGLGVEFRSLARAAGRVILAASASLLMLGAISIALIRFLAP